MRWLFPLCLIFLPQLALAELTKQDLQEINALILQSEERMKQYIDAKIEATNAKIEAVSTKTDAKIETLSVRIDGMERELTILEWVIGLIGAGFLAILTIPQFMERKELREQIDRLIRAGQEDRLRIDELERRLRKEVNV